ncbi:MAG: tripartite tricarboxylate transporter TctB family protein [Planctomycetota bacterium]
MKKQSLDVSWEGTEGFEKSLKSIDEQLGRLLLSDAFASLREEAFPPFAFPGVIALVIALTGIAWAFRSRRDGDAATPESGTPAAETTRRGRIQAASCIVAVLAYVAIAETIGFVLTIATLLTVLFWRFGSRAWVSACLACGLAVATYQLFAVYLRVPLPRGFLGW